MDPSKGGKNRLLKTLPFILSRRTQTTRLWFRTANNGNVQSLVRSIVGWHSSLFFFWLSTAHFSRTLRCAYWFATSLTHSPAHGKVNASMYQHEAVLNHSALTHTNLSGFYCVDPHQVGGSAKFGGGFEKGKIFGLPQSRQSRG